MRRGRRGGHGRGGAVLTPSILGALAALALLDSASVGTLVIPLALALRPRARPMHVWCYLLTITVFYSGVGALLLWASDLLRHLDPAALDGPAVDVVQIAVAVGLLALSEHLTPARRAARRAASRDDPARRPRMERWRRRVEAGDTGWALLVGLAVLAGVVELASMLPYLAAIGIIATNGVPVPTALLLLAGYAAVMIAPAVVLTTLRFALGSRVERPLEAVHGWISARGASAASWVVGIVGVLLLLDGVSRLVAP